MFEKVNPSHPDKIADRIAGAIVDLAYKKNKRPKVACEVLLGHGRCYIINETSEKFTYDEIRVIVDRIAGENIIIDYSETTQDTHLANNQELQIRAGDNGIFKGVPTTQEQKKLVVIAKDIYKRCPFDGKYILSNEKIIICQSHAKTENLKKHYPNAIINPIGDWTGGSDVDSGATNRKLGSDMGDAVTGGGLHGKDLSKADVSVNIYCHIMAQQTNKIITAFCAIGDTDIKFYANDELYTSVPYNIITKVAQDYIDEIGGFEKLAVWGLLR